MKISINEIKQAFVYLIKEEKTREELASWAQRLQSAEDNGELEYEPPGEEDKIWNGIEYLMGVDLKDIDGSYLHSAESFIFYKNKNDF